MDLLIATHNPGKRDEIERILKPLGVNVVLPDEMGIDLPQVDETGETFEQNAMLKAVSGCSFSGMPCISDDSGLCIDALNGAPGVYTARYGGEDLPFPEKIKKLLDEMADVPSDKRSARFVCCVCCVFPDGTRITSRGECEGSIAYKASGTTGFGFDPVFVVDGRSFSEFSDEEKDNVSHRGKALRLFASRLKETL